LRQNKKKKKENKTKRLVPNAVEVGFGAVACTIVKKMGNGKKGIYSHHWQSIAVSVLTVYHLVEIVLVTGNDHD